MNKNNKTKTQEKNQQQNQPKKQEKPKFAKKFETKDKKEYYGPDIDLSTPIKNQKKENIQIPFFLNIDGEFLDIYLQKVGDLKNIQNKIKQKYSQEIQKEKEKEMKKKIKKKQNILLKNIPQNYQNLPPFPLIDNYKNYSDYEQAVLDWKANVEKIVGFAKLPHMMGRVYPRPFLNQDKTEIEDQERSSGTDSGRTSSDIRRTSSGHKNPIPKIGNLSHISQFTKSQKEIEDIKIDENEKEKGPPKFYPETELVMKENESWKNQLIIPPPEVDYFNTFEEYEQANINWAKLVLNQNKLIPLHPKQFHDLYSIKTVVEIEEIQKKKKEKENAILFRERTKTKRTKQINTRNDFNDWKEKIDMINNYYSNNYGKFAIENVRFILTGKNLRQRNEEEYLKEKERKRLEFEKEMKRIENEKKQIKDNEETEMLMKHSNTENVHKNLSKLTQKKEGIGIWKKLKEETKKHIKDFFQTITLHTEYNLREYKSSVKPILGKVHGIFTLTKQSGSITSSSINIQSEGVCAIRRNDVKETIIQRSFDCEPEIESKSVFFQIPQHDLKGKINVANFSENIYKLRKEIDQLSNAHEINKLNSFYYPKKFDQNKIKKQQAVIEEFSKNDQQYFLANLPKLFQSELYLDSFSELLSKYLVHKFSEITFSNFFYSLTLPEQFKDILEIFHDSCSLLTHAKIGQFIIEGLQGNYAQEIFKKYCTDFDYSNLFHIAYGANLLEKIPRKVFPPYLFLNYYKSPFRNYEVEKTILSHYYLSIIQQKISDQSQGFLFVGVSRSIPQLISNMKNTMIQMASINIPFLQNDLFEGIKSKSSMISSYYCLILEHLVGIDDDSLIKLLQNPKINLLENIRIFSKHKFSHIKFCIQKIWHKLINIQAWRNHISVQYSSSYSKLIEDLENPQKDLNENPKVPLMVVLLTEFFRMVFSKKIENNYDSESLQLLRSKFFYDIVARIKRDIDSNSTTNTLIYLSKILVLMQKAFDKFQLITGTKENKIQIDEKKQFLEINLSFLNTIIDILLRAPQSLNQMKYNFIVLLRRLLENQSVFQIVEDERDFFTHLSSLFRSMTEDKICRELWGIFFDSIAYHSGLVSKLGNLNVLSGLLQWISSVSHPCIIIYGLKTLNHILNLDRLKDEALSKKILKMRNSSKKPFKDDLKFFTDFFEKNKCFVNIHMIFKKFENQKGTIFSILSQIYLTIFENQNCKKIFAEIKKNESYVEGFETFSTFFTDQKRKKFGTIKKKKSQKHKQN